MNRLIIITILCVLPFISGEYDTLTTPFSTSRSCSGGIIYDNYCIQLALCSQVNFPEAEETCKKMGSTLVEITSMDKYKTLYVYLLSTLYGNCKEICKGKCSGMLKVSAWVGSRFEQTNNPNNVITLQNGKKVQLGDWYPNYPAKDSARQGFVNLAIQADADFRSKYQGLVNFPPNWGSIPLCSFKMT